MYKPTIFSDMTASRVTGIPERTLARWDNSGFFVSSLGDHERGGGFRRLYSYMDLLALRTIQRLREQGISMQQLQQVRDLYLDRESNAEWVQRRFYLLGKRLFLCEDEMLATEKPLGQLADHYVLGVEDIVSEVDQGIASLSVRWPDEIGRIERHRRILGGQPRIAGTRTPVSLIASLIDEGISDEQILREFDRLRKEDIDAVRDYIASNEVRAAS